MPSTVLDEQEIRHLKGQYMTERTSYVRGLIEIEYKKNLVTEEFMSENSNQLGFVDKWLPLGNFTDPQQDQLYHLYAMNAKLAMNNGLDKTAAETMIDAWRMIGITRAKGGFFQKELNMERHDIHEEHKTQGEKRLGFLANLFNRRQEPAQGGQQQ